MKEIKSIDRSFQNHKNEVIETDVPRSGDNLSYRNHLGGLILGRLYPQSFQHLLPGCKFSGNNTASIIFEQLATPVIDDVDVCVHNFLVTIRSIDNRWEKFMTPTKLNGMNSSVSAPTFDMSKILGAVLDFLDNIIHLDSNLGNDYIEVNLQYFPSSIWDSVYHSDALLDLKDQIRSFIPGGALSYNFNITNSSHMNIFMRIFSCVFEFFVGKRSLLDYLGYDFITREQLDQACFEYFNTNSQGAYVDLSTYCSISSDFSSFLLNSGQSPNYANTFLYLSGNDGHVRTDIYSLQNEYALRAYYAVWFEYYRNYDLEPRSNNLPEYREFGASSIFDQYQISDLHYLVPRIRSWQQDAFTTAGIDDISRHVFAPVLNESGLMVGQEIPGDDLAPNMIGDNKLTIQNISWRNPATGQVNYVNVPMPAKLMDVLAPSNSWYSNYGLELFSLRKAQMLENYLKRIYYGGDEYRDRMLHLYGARIEDYRINRPQWLSSSIDSIQPRQEVANTGVSPEDNDPLKTSIGKRFATATAEQSGNDGFTEFCPEFGIYISILSIMPHATYDPYILQNMQIKYRDFPIPQFANQMEDLISTKEISRSVQHSAFGYAPYGHAYRYRVDEVHGDFHDDKFDYVFLRYYNATNIPNLSWGFIHCRPALPMFVDSLLLDGQCYGTFKHNFLVEHPLPSPVETI